jgi:predicted metal-dependent hydrolase
VRRSEKARRVRLRVHQDGRVEVVVPKRGRAPKDFLDGFVRENAEWIRKQQARFTARAQTAERARYELSGQVSFRGRAVPLAFCPSKDGRTGIRLDGEAFHVTSTVETTPADVRALLEALFRRMARDVFEERVRALNAESGYAWTSIRIGEQKTRWGSCSRRGTLSFNWRLLMAPPEVLDYVVIHELAHLAEMNHSSRFWALVAARCPGYEAHVRWLKEHGTALVL